MQAFGAFVDLGGVDGLIHISQLSWDRIKHAEEVLQLGQAVKVKIVKIDPDTGKIGLAFRDLSENPWANAAHDFPSRSRVKGRVTRLMEFGAFVRLGPGVEGLIHISELSHKRVFRVSDVLGEGQDVEVMVLSVDAEQQRISLSLKALETKAAPAESRSRAGRTRNAPRASEEAQGAAQGRHRRPLNRRTIRAEVVARLGITNSPPRRVLARYRHTIGAGVAAGRYPATRQVRAQSFDARGRHASSQIDVQFDEVCQSCERLQAVVGHLVRFIQRQAP